MQTKLTLRMDDAVVRKAKRLARNRGSSVSKIFSDYITEEADDPDLNDLGTMTTAMIGVLRGLDISGEKEAYHDHLQDKYL